VPVRDGAGEGLRRDAHRGHRRLDGHLDLRRTHLLPPVAQPLARRPDAEHLGADMLRILHDTKYDFIKPWRIAIGITVAFIATGLIFLGVHHGLNRSIEFTGGTLVQAEFAKRPDVGDLRGTIDAAGFRGAEIQQFGSDTSFTIRAAGHQTTGGKVENTATEIQTALEQKYGKANVHIARTEIVGPRVGDELSRNAMIAIVISLGITMIYLAFRFEWRFGVAAVIATAHDLLSTLAFLAIMRLEVSLTVVAALLTVLGLSLKHNTTHLPRGP